MTNQNTNTTTTSGFSMFEDAAVVLRILMQIPLGRSVSMKDIDAALKEQGIVLQRRTLQRYLQAIRRQPDFFPIEADTSTRPHTFRWASRDRRFLIAEASPAEALVLRLAEATLDHEIPHHVAALLKSFYKTDPRNAPEGAGWAGKIKVLPDALIAPPPVQRPFVFERVATALYEGRILAVKLAGRHNKTGEVRCSPLGIVKRDGRLLLVGMWGDDPEPSHVALERIAQARLTDFKVERPEGFDLDLYASRAALTRDRGRRIRLDLLIDDPLFVESLEERPLGRGQTIRRDADAPERWVLSTEIEDSDLLEAWIALNQRSILRVSRSPLA